MKIRIIKFLRIILFRCTATMPRVKNPGAFVVYGQLVFFSHKHAFHVKNERNDPWHDPSGHLLLWFQTYAVSLRNEMIPIKAINIMRLELILCLLLRWLNARYKDMGFYQFIQNFESWDDAAFRTINQLRDRKSKAPIALNDGAVITEKIAILLRVGVGDELEFKNDDGTFKTIKIAGITENYAGHYLYMAPAYYEEIFEKKYHANSDYILLRNQSAASVSIFSRSMLEKDFVLSTLNTNAVSNAIGDLTQSLNIVVLVLVLVSSLLAIVVLYNLTNINVSERIRELSTIMVLGFYPREVTAYVYRETMILTVIGIIIGYVFGLLLHHFIVTALPPVSVLFDPAVKPDSYILAAVFTFAFSFIVMLIMHRRLKRINMVEALKAVE